jgi:chromosome segregation ATPase
MKKPILIFASAVILVSCNTTKNAGELTRLAKRERSPATGWSGNYDMDNVNVITGGTPQEQKESDKDIRRMVIYNASLELAIKNADTVNANLTRIAARYNGYVLTLGNSRSVIRVKAASLKPAVDEACRLGKVKYKNIYGDDVTEDYEDSQIRLDNAKKARQRYLELLAKAENVQAALMVEKELERLNKEIDSLEGKIKRLEHLSDFSTITVNMQKKVKPGVLGYIGMGLYYSVKWLFVRN